MKTLFLLFALFLLVLLFVFLKRLFNTDITDDTYTGAFQQRKAQYYKNLYK